MRKSLVVACTITLIISVIGALIVCDHLFGLSNRQSSAGNALTSTFASRILSEERELIVRLPESYAREPARRYPVIYVLDGSSQDGHTANTAALMARIGLMPELIVVGLPNVSGAGRQRDYTPPFIAQEADAPNGPRGEADRFFSFFKTELIPKIESEYRTAPFRMLAGHSRGGLLVSYSLIAEPELFDARFAHSPALWRENGVMIDKLKEFLSANADLSGFFYMSIGSEENEKMMAAYRQACSVFEHARVTGLRWQANIVAGADHSNNGEMATPLGFKALYQSRIAGDSNHVAHR